MRASIHFPSRKRSRFLIIQENWSWFRLTSSNLLSTPLQKEIFNMVIYPNQIALNYLAEGFSPIPVKFQSKEPKIKGWPELTVSANNIGDYFNGDPTNIGVLTGTPSGGLVDVDIDSPGALKFAPYFLPETNCIFGRPSKRQSHWLYRVDDIGGHETFVGDTMVIELRGQKHYTLFPGSTHPSGELIEFACPKDRTPAAWR